MYLSYIFMFPNLYLAPLPYYSFVNLITRKEDFSNYKYTSCFKNLLKAILFSLGEVVIGSRVNTNVYLSEEWK
jgi:lysophospholipid acyltransferase